MGANVLFRLLIAARAAPSVSTLSSALFGQVVAADITAIGDAPAPLITTSTAALQEVERAHGVGGGGHTSGTAPKFASAEDDDRAIASASADGTRCLGWGVCYGG